MSHATHHVAGMDFCVGRMHLYTCTSGCHKPNIVNQAKVLLLLVSSMLLLRHALDSYMLQCTGMSTLLRGYMY